MVSDHESVQVWELPWPQGVMAAEAVPSAHEALGFGRRGSLRRGLDRVALGLPYGKAIRRG